MTAMKSGGYIEGATLLTDRVAQPSYTFLVTGGAGSIGSAFVEQLLDDYPTSTIRVLDNNEYFLWELRDRLKDKHLRWLLGDIRDLQRMKQAVRGVDVIINCAAVKHVNLNEYNPRAALEVNSLGTQVLIDAALDTGTVQGFLQLSTDKAVNPTSVMGATKLVAERLIVAANFVRGDAPTRFVNIRLPNVRQTRGNVFELWQRQKERGEPLTVTSRKMRRYVIEISDCTNLMGFAVKYLLEGRLTGGETLLPSTVKEYSIVQLAQEYSENIKIIGASFGEKEREELLTDEELHRVIELEPFKIIQPEPFSILKGNDNE